MKLHTEILDSARQKLLQELGFLSPRFYVAGGTALALQIGHRESIDFDFFSQEMFDVELLRTELSSKLASHTITVAQSAPSTLSILVDGSISLSFLGYNYPLVGSLVETSDVPLASVEDIGCMKLSAIISRSTLRDYIDLYFILQSIKLDRLLELARQKFPSIDPNVILKALVYFEDIGGEPISFRSGFSISRPKLEAFLVNTVKNYETSRG